jgi:protocatechuate 3,4-dioxygenase beta subunit
MRPTPRHTDLDLPQDAPAHDPHGGLEADLKRLLAQQQRRRTLGWLGAVGGLGVLGLSACGGGSTDGSTGGSGTSGSSSGSASTSSDTGSSTDTSSDTSTDTSDSTDTTSDTSTDTSTCSVINEETAGPYPGDGSNTSNGSVANALSLSGIVRSDIRTSVGSASGTAAGVPMKVVIKLVNVNSSCASLSGYAIYLWHCDAQGRYSMYSSAVINENYLRGVQSTDSSGTVTFQTIVPGCYSGRMPHMHFEVYRDANTATSYTNKLKTSQLAFPTDICSAVYSSNSNYTGSSSNLAKISFATDNVFSDGVTLELTTVTGNSTDGYTATITVGISV